MGEHAKLSPSSAKKWLNCSLSVDLESGISEEASVFALEGTTAHTLGELKLQLGMNLISFIDYNNAVSKLEVDSDMELHTDNYRDYVIETINSYNDINLEIEMKVDLSEYVPESFGTSDIVLINSEHLEIIDFKYGKGVKVDADDNYQLMLYALGVLDNFSFLYEPKAVKMTIYQPRLDNISSFEMSAKDLYVWGEVVKEKAHKAFNEGGVCEVGDWCSSGFCKARPICRKYVDDIFVIEKFDFKDVNKLNNDDIAEILSKVDKLTKYAKLIKTYAIKKLLEGEEIKGFKVVAGKSNRTFNADDDTIANALCKGFGEILDEDDNLTIDDFYEKKLLSITELEKKYGAKNIEIVLKNHIVKPVGAPTLAKSTDKRKAINSIETAISDFAEALDGGD